VRLSENASARGRRSTLGCADVLGRADAIKRAAVDEPLIHSEVLPAMTLPANQSRQRLISRS